jgi:hypothetical protein
MKKIVAYSHEVVQRPSLIVGRPFTLTELPIELQSMILKHKDWIRERYRSAISTVHRRSKLGRCRKCCGHCGGCKHPEYIYRHLCYYNRHDFSSYSSSCKCNLRDPSPLFTMSHTIREYSLNLYYGRSDFCVASSVSEIINQINSVGHDCLQRVRRLRIKIEQIPGYHLLRESYDSFYDLYDSLDELPTKDPEC